MRRRPWDWRLVRGTPETRSPENCPDCYENCMREMLENTCRIAGSFCVSAPTSSVEAECRDPARRLVWVGGHVQGWLDNMHLVCGPSWEVEMFSRLHMAALAAGYDGDDDPGRL